MSSLRSSSAEGLRYGEQVFIADNHGNVLYQFHQATATSLEVKITIFNLLELGTNAFFKAAPCLTVKLTEDNCPKSLSAVMDMVVLLLEGYHSYLGKKNTKWPTRLAITQLHAMTTGGILYTPSFYFSKNNLDEHAPVQPSEIPMDFFNHVYVGTLLEPSTWKSETVDKARSIYVQGVQAIHNTELIKLRIDIGDMDIADSELRIVLQSVLGRIGYGAAYRCPSDVQVHVVFVVREACKGHINSILSPNENDISMVGAFHRDQEYAALQVEYVRACRYWRLQTDGSASTHANYNSDGMVFMPVEARLQVTMEVRQD